MPRYDSSRAARFGETSTSSKASARPAAQRPARCVARTRATKHISMAVASSINAEDRSSIPIRIQAPRTQTINGRNERVKLAIYACFFASSTPTYRISATRARSEG